MPGTSQEGTEPPALPPAVLSHVMAQAAPVVGWVFNGLMVVLLSVGAYLGRNALEKIDGVREEMAGLRTELAVINQRIVQADKNAERIAALEAELRARTADRITATQFNGWRQVHEDREEARDQRHQDDLKRHAELPGHPQERAEHAETKRRVGRNEEDIKAIKEALKR